MAYNSDVSDTAFINQVLQQRETSFGLSVNMSNELQSPKRPNVLCINAADAPLITLFVQSYLAAHICVTLVLHAHEYSSRSHSASVHENPSLRNRTRNPKPISTATDGHVDTEQVNRIIRAILNSVPSHWISDFHV
jgi:hypothetical protein